MTEAAKLPPLFDELEALHRTMLESARNDDWEDVARIGQRVDQIVSQLSQLQHGQPTDAATRAALAAQLKRTLDIVVELRALAEPARAACAAQLASDAQRNKLNNSYGA